MAELADAQDLGSCEVIRVGSTPTTRTKSEQALYRLLRLFCCCIYTAVISIEGPLQNKPIKNKRGLEPERVSKPRRLLYS